MQRRIPLDSGQLLIIALVFYVGYGGCGGDGEEAVPTGPEVVETTPAVVETVSEGPGRPSVLRFDGSDDRVTVPYSPTFPTEVFTLGAWIKLPPPSRRAAIIARGEDDNSFNLSWQLYVLPDGTLEVMLEDSRENNYCYPSNSCTPLGSCSGGDLFVADDVWHHVAVTREASGTLSIYVDGDRRASCDGTGVPSSNNFQVLSIGCTFGTIGPPPGGREPPTWFFPGLIDEPAIWALVLPDAQIGAVMSSGVDASSPRSGRLLELRRGWRTVGRRPLGGRERRFPGREPSAGQCGCGMGGRRGPIAW